MSPRFPASCQRNILRRHIRKSKFLVTGRVLSLAASHEAASSLCDWVLSCAFCKDETEFVDSVCIIAGFKVHSALLPSLGLCLFIAVPPNTVLLTLCYTHHYCSLLQARRRRPCPSSCTSTANRTSGTPATRTTAASWPATGRSWSSPSTSVLVCWVSSAMRRYVLCHRLQHFETVHHVYKFLGV